MEEITIDLREVFDGDTVVITVNGEEVWRGESVSTDYSIGLAEIVRATSPRGAMVCEASVLNRRLTAEFETELEGPLFLGVRIDETGQLQIEASSEPKFYL